tara:strand:+ start:3037 stop:3915 length:879 start_codon:yes stop_codon:yes gene_type:complete
MKNKIIIGIGKGRDGTASLKVNLENIVQFNNINCHVYHEKYVKEIYNNYHQYYENKKILEKKNNEILGKFELGNIYVGNGYILILNILKKKFGDKLKIIRVYRNQKEWKKSFIKNIKFYPKKHGNYSKLLNPEIFRMAAFHFDDLSIKDWNKLSLEKKLSWYYKKNNQIFKNINFKKSNKFELSNKQMNKKKYLEKIVKFIDAKWKMPTNIFKVNVSHIDYKSLGNFDKKIVGTFYRDFDYLMAAKDPCYGFDFFLKKVVFGYKYRNEYIHSSISKKQLIYAKKLAKKFLNF